MLFGVVFLIVSASLLLYFSMSLLVCSSLRFCFSTMKNFLKSHQRTLKYTLNEPKIHPESNISTVDLKPALNLPRQRFGD